MSIRISIVALTVFSVTSASCSFGIRESVIPTQASLTITATLPATITPGPSETSLPLPPQPTMAPVEGTTSTQVNVRAEPSTASNVLGIIPANTTVEITGKDPGDSWWQINYAQGIDGKGWVTAQYITLAGTPQIPTILGDEIDGNNGNVAIVQQQLNVRSGPGTDFNSLGMLNPQDVVKLTGKDPNGAWLQIEFSNGPEGKGWVNAAFVQASGAETLPIITEAGQIVGTGTPTEIPFTPTVTLVPAMSDGDSAQAPAVNVTFTSSGTQALQYSSDVSAPSGDTEDWLQFIPYTDHILLEASCEGTNVYIELIQSEQSILQVRTENCAAQQIIRVLPDAVVQVRVHAISSGSLNYSFYTLNIRTLP